MASDRAACSARVLRCGCGRYGAVTFAVTDSVIHLQRTALGRFGRSSGVRRKQANDPNIRAVYYNCCATAAVPQPLPLRSYWLRVRAGVVVGRRTVPHGAVFCGQLHRDHRVTGVAWRGMAINSARR
jgi:hypothetical protein